MEAVTEDVLTVTLNGKEHPLIFPIEAIRKAKKKFGGLKKMLDADSDEVLPELLAAGISQPEITEDWVVKNVPFPKLMRERDKLIAAFMGKTKSEYEQELAEAATKKAQAQLTAA